MKPKSLSVNRPLLLLATFVLAIVVVGTGAVAGTRDRGAATELFFRRLGHPGETYGDEVQQICIDRDGYAWLATTERLLRFDGSRVRPYGGDLRGVRLAVDSAGCLYASAPHQAYVYDRNTDSFNPLPGIRWALADATGRIWLFPAGLRAAVCGSDTIILPVGPVAATAARGAGLGAWLVDSVGRLWHARPDSAPRRIDSIPLSSPRAASLYADLSGNILYWDMFAPGLRRVSPDGVRSGHLSGFIVRALVQNPDGDFWIASDHNGLLGATSDMRLRPVATTGLPSNHTSAITLDSRRRLWVGAPWGAALARPGRLGIRRHRIATAQDISVVLPAPDGNLWLGIDGGGLMSLDSDDDRVIKRVPTDVTGTPGDRITGIIPCGDSSWLVLTYGNGAWLHNPVGDGADISDDFTPVSGAPAHVRAAIRTPRAGHIWVASHMSGIYGFDPLRPGASTYLRASDSGLRTEYINDITSTPDDTVYAATGYGVYRFHTSDPRPRPLTGMLDTIAARAIAADTRSDIWIGTHSGLYRYRAATGALNAIPALSGQCVNKISVDDRGHVWALCPTALYRVIPAPDSRTAVATFALGEDIPAINVTSMTVAPERIYLGGNGKFIEIIPPAPNSLPELPARILLPDYPPGIDEISVAAGTPSLRLATTALTQTPPPVLYRFNPDHQWKTVPSGAEALLPLDSLSPGTYSLQLRVATDPLAPVRDITLHITDASTVVRTIIIVIVMTFLIVLTVILIVTLRRRSHHYEAISPDSSVPRASSVRPVYYPVESTPVNPDSQDRRFLDRAREIVEASMADPDFGVDTFARLMCVSRSGLYKRLTALTGLSPLEYIRRMRLSRARDLLRARAGTVAEVAFAVGMAPRQFSKLYRQQYGILPSKDMSSAPGTMAKEESENYE